MARNLKSVRAKSVSATVADATLAQIVGAAPAPAPAPVPESFVRQLSQQESTGAARKSYNTDRGVDWNALRTDEARSSVASASALQAFHRALVDTIATSGLTDKDFLDAYHRWCLSAKLSGGVAYTRTEPRKNAWVSKMRSALKAYPKPIATAEEGEGYLDALRGKSKSPTPKGESTAEDILKMIVSLSTTYKNRGGDLEKLVEAIDAKWSA